MSTHTITSAPGRGTARPVRGTARPGRATERGTGTRVTAVRPALARVVARGLDGAFGVVGVLALVGAVLGVVLTS